MNRGENWTNVFDIGDRPEGTSGRLNSAMGKRKIKIIKKKRYSNDHPLPLCPEDQPLAPWKHEVVLRGFCVFFFNVNTLSPLLFVCHCSSPRGSSAFQESKASQDGGGRAQESGLAESRDDRPIGGGRGGGGGGSGLETRRSLRASGSAFELEAGDGGGTVLENGDDGRGSAVGTGDGQLAVSAAVAGGVPKKSWKERAAALEEKKEGEGEAESAGPPIAKPWQRQPKKATASVKNGAAAAAAGGGGGVVVGDDGEAVDAPTAAAAKPWLRKKKAVAAAASASVGGADGGGGAGGVDGAASSAVDRPRAAKPWQRRKASGAGGSGDGRGDEGVVVAAAGEVLVEEAGEGEGEGGVMELEACLEERDWKKRVAVFEVFVVSGNGGGVYRGG